MPVGWVFELIYLVCPTETENKAFFFRSDRLTDESHLSTGGGVLTNSTVYPRFEILYINHRRSRTYVQTVLSTIYCIIYVIQ